MKKNIENKKIKRKDYLEFLAAFMIVLILTIPFYVSNAFAQAIPSVADAGQSCIDKNRKTNDLVEILDNDIIRVLESIFAIFHAINSIWVAYKSFSNVVILFLYSVDPNCWDIAAIPDVGEVTACSARNLENARLFKDNPIGGGMQSLLNYLLSCDLPEGIPSLCGTNIKLFDEEINLDGQPFNNIYSAIACLCIPGILFNMRKLKTIYQTHNCCVEQACTNGISTEACERQLSEALCMYWGKGSLIMGIVTILMSIAGQLLFTKLIEEWVTQKPKYVGTLISLANIPFEIQALVNGFDWVSKTFSEPTCEELGFDKIKEQSKKDIAYQSQSCRLIDRNGDNIFDDLLCTS